MRMMMKVSIPVETGNALAKSGKLGSTLKSILDELKPEAAYFVAIDGVRTGMIFVDLKEPSDLPKAAEPFFLALNAAIEVVPAMVPEDLGKAAPHIEAAAKKYS